MSRFNGMWNCGMVGGASLLNELEAKGIVFTHTLKVAKVKLFAEENCRNSKLNRVVWKFTI